MIYQTVLFSETGYPIYLYMKIYAYMGCEFFSNFFCCYEMSKYNNPNITIRVIFEELIRLDRVTKCGRFSVHVGTCQDSKYGSEEGKFYRLDKVKTLDFSFRLELTCGV